MAEKQDKTEKYFIDKLGRITKRWGPGEPNGRILGTLFFSETPLTQKQIAEKTGYTLSLVSPGLKYLESNNFVVKKRGEGKEKLYEANISFTEGFKLFIRQFLEKDIKPLIAELENYKPRSKEKEKQIKNLIREYKKVQRFFNLAEKMHCMKKNKINEIKKILGDEK